MSFPSKVQRQSCYDARDKFWECLDANGDKLEACKNFRKVFEENCAATWVKHFDRKRDYEKFKEEMDDSDWTFKPDEEIPKKPKQ